MTVADRLEYDYCIVGAGPAGLACAIRLKQLLPDATVCVLDKAAAVGAHALSGAVLEPSPLDQLLPGWRAQYPGLLVPVAGDEFRFLTAHRSIRLPVPPTMRNHGNLILSIGQLTRWLAQQAEALGAEVFPGFSAMEPLYNPDGSVGGIRTGDMGRRQDGTEGPNFSPGVEIAAKVTLMAEGCRGSVTKQLIRRFALDQGRCAPTYALGFKELWQLPAGRVSPGLVQHTAGWPLDRRTYGGGFLYHLAGDRVYVGFVVGLDYRDPRLSPFEAFQQFKHHPSVRSLLEGGEILSAGARSIAAGGWQSLPAMDMPGALLIGDAAGTLNVPKIKGIHQALRSGVCAAEHLAAAGSTSGFDQRWRASTGGQELWRVRNIKPAFRHGFWLGFANGAWELLVQGRSPWTLAHHDNAGETRRLSALPRGEARWQSRTLPPRDRASSVFFAANRHDERQPVHLKVADTSICVERCTMEFGNPCQYFCPAGVYEILEEGEGRRRLQINAANCIHCKACDIKDPYSLITWTPPEGGSGPNYQDL